MQQSVLLQAILARVLIIAATCMSPLAIESAAVAEDVSASVGNQACAACHASIYQSYGRTAMARASGPARENVIPADFVHPDSGVHYRVYSEPNHVWLSFDRPGDPAVRGKRELLYYIGSGRRGLSYLFARNGFLFESPINWYGNAQRWDMAPAYQNAREIPLNLPAVTSCLRCHVSGMRAPVSGTENFYPSPVFTHAGVSCERCHGPGAAHVAGGAGAIVNPARLSPERRDAVCMQCHLEGKVAIERPGRHAYDFQPGESLFDYLRFYVLPGNQSGLRGVSQVEALRQSICKRKSGDAMSCTSCHDPHYEPPAEERVAYYREKCLACHGGHFAAKHHVNQPDCTHPMREDVKRKHFPTPLREASIGACIQAPSSSWRGFWFNAWSATQYDRDRDRSCWSPVSGFMQRSRHHGCEAVQANRWL